MTKNQYAKRMSKFLDSGEFVHDIGTTDPEQSLLIINKAIRLRQNTLFRAAASFLVEMIASSGHEEEQLKQRLEKVRKHKSALNDKSIMDKNLIVADNVETLINSCQDLKLKTAMSMLYDSGCRRSELLGIKVGDLKIVNNANIAAEVSVKGKRSVFRTIFFTPYTVALIRKLIIAEKLSNKDFIISFAGTKSDVQNQASMLYFFINQHGKKVLGETASIHPHMFRHACAIRMSKSGVDFRDIQQYLGHTDITTTQIYAKYSDSRKRDAVQKYFGERHNG
jgi:integrase